MSMQYQKKAQKSGGGLFSGLASLFSKSKDAAKPESKPKKQEKPSRRIQKMDMMGCAMGSMMNCELGLDDMDSAMEYNDMMQES